MVEIERKLTLILLFSMTFISLSLPLILEYINCYAAPTASYALFIKRNGKLISNPIHNSIKYWGNAINVEVTFPLPAILLSMFTIITDISEELSLFIPIRGLSNIILFALAKQLLCLTDKTRGILFSAIYYASTITLYMLGGSIIDRAELGVAFLTFFLYNYMLILKSSINRQMTLHICPFCSLIIFTLATGFTYYTAIISILIITLFTSVIVNKISSIHLPILHISAISILMIIYQPFYYSYIRSANLAKFMENALGFMKAQLKIEIGTEAFYLGEGYVDIDMFSRVSAVWLSTIVRLLSILGIIYIFLKHFPNKRVYDRNKMFYWIYSLIVLLAGLGELAYSFIAPTLSIRFISFFGLIALLYTIIEGIRTKSIKRIFTLMILGIIIISNIGSFRYKWLYGTPKPLGYRKLNPLLTFCTSYSIDNELTVVADAYYSAIGFFHSVTFNKYENVIYEPFGKDIILLFKSLLIYDLNNITIVLRNRGVKYMLHVYESRPIWGDGWGYAIQLQNAELLEMRLSIVYNEKNLLLLRL